MILGIPLPFAETKIIYEWNRFQALDQWWHWLVLLVACFALVSYFTVWYRRDAAELPRAIRWGLLLLRLSALVGILIFFFDLQKRSEQRIVRPSRVAVLVDTSLSMGLPADWQPEQSGILGSRIDQVVETLKSDKLLPTLRENHEVAVYRFDSSTRPIPVSAYGKLGKAQDQEAAQDDPNAVLAVARQLTWLATAMGGLALIALVIGRLGGRSKKDSESFGYWTLLGIVASISAVVVLAVAVLRVPEVPWAELWGSQPWSGADKGASQQDLAKPAESNVDFSAALTARGAETRLGDVIRALLEQERGSPLAGLIVFTDGRSNAGIEPLTAAVTAQSMSVPIFFVGVGSERSAPNVRLVEVEAPRRVYPGDKFTISFVVQANGLKGSSATARLRRRSAVDTNGNWTSEDEQTVALGDDEELVSGRFEVEPREIGRWTYEVSLLVPQADSNEKDNSQAREVQVIERKSRVLIVSSGPNREYQFVRNLLFRDKDVESDVLLQSGSPGMSQEADRLLTEFPSTRDEMLQYDAVLAFDADWMKLSETQIQVLEQWVAEQAGGLLMVAGPVATPKWSGFGGADRRVDLLRGLSPVVLDGRSARLTSSGRFESEKAWPLDLTQDGLSSDFLWLKDDRSESEIEWKSFAGVFSYFSCYEAKPGAKVLANFSDPTTSSNNRLPIYIASQFYGGGRVVFQGSGEMWRIRELSDALFDTYYIKLVRWISQGRLLRDSDRGLLLLDKDQALIGDQIAVRAVLKDEQFQPLTDPEVRCRLVDPSGRSIPLTLRELQDAAQPGVYVGQFICEAEGTYDVQLPLESLNKLEVLTQQVIAKVPAREIQQPQRNDALMTELASRSKGKYFAGVPSALASTNGRPAVVDAIAPQDQVTYLPGTPDRQFQLRLMTMLMALIAGALSLEWLLRRLNKLA